MKKTTRSTITAPPETSEEMLILAPATDIGLPRPKDPPAARVFEDQNRAWLNYVRCLVDEGVFFPFADDYALPRELPPSLAPFKCILIDPRRKAEFEKAPQARRLQEFQRQGGFLAWADLNQPAGGALGDSMVRPRVYRMIATAGLATHHPAMLQRLQDKAEPPMLARWKQAASEELDMYRRMGHAFCDPPGYITFRAASEAADYFQDAALAEPVRDYIAAHHAGYGKEFDSCGGRYFLQLFERSGDQRLLQVVREFFDRERQWRLGGVVLNCELQPPPGSAADNPPPRVTANAWTWPETAANYGDTLPYLSRVTGDPRYAERALTHVLGAHRWMFDAALGLWYHIGRPTGPDRRSAPWGRGNAWFLYALRGLLDDLPDEHPRRKDVAAILRQGLEGILKTQDRHGLWYNVLDAAEGESRQCSSATSRFIHVFARAYWKGWLRDERIPPMVERAWKGLKTKIWDWQLIAYCVGTPYMLRRQGYLSRPHDTFRCSRSSLLLAWIELQRLRGKPAGRP